MKKGIICISGLVAFFTGGMSRLPACTTILAGKNATYDGSTMIARNEDSGSGYYDPKKFIVVEPERQPAEYTSVTSHLKIRLPENPQRYTSMPNAIPDNGIWAEAGVNESNVAMTATETITANARLLGADPFVKYEKGSEDKPDKIGGIGEEDLVVILLPYIHSAREGVLRLGELLEKYGTYESNGIAFSDVNEIWYAETLGGHHWIARRVPDNSYAVIPNQLGIDNFNLDDALGAGKENMCSADLAEFIEKNHLDLSLARSPSGRIINPREVFGTQNDLDRVYSTSRSWYVERYFNSHTSVWEGPNADYTPESAAIPWCRIPEKKITVEDLKYILSSHYQGTPYDPYETKGDTTLGGIYRPIGINRNSELALFQIRPYVHESYRTIEWVAFGSNVFNAFVPFYVNSNSTPDYLSNTTAEVTTDSFYWANRIIAVMADAVYSKSTEDIDTYQTNVLSKGHEIIASYDKRLYDAADDAAGIALCEKANAEIAEMLKNETQDLLSKVLLKASNNMKNIYSLSD